MATIEMAEDKMHRPFSLNTSVEKDVVLTTYSPGERRGCAENALRRGPHGHY